MGNSFCGTNYYDLKQGSVQELHFLFSSGGRKCLSKHLRLYNTTPFTLRSWSFKIALSMQRFSSYEQNGSLSCVLHYFTTEYFKREVRVNSSIHLEMF